MENPYCPEWQGKGEHNIVAVADQYSLSNTLVKVSSYGLRTTRSLPVSLNGQPKPYCLYNYVLIRDKLSKTFKL